MSLRYNTGFIPAPSCVSPVIYARERDAMAVFAVVLVGSSLLPFCAILCPLASSSSSAFTSLTFSLVGCCRPLCYDDAEYVARRGNSALVRTLVQYVVMSAPFTLFFFFMTPCPVNGGCTHSHGHAPLVSFHFPFPLPNRRPPEGSTLRSAYGGGPWVALRYQAPAGKYW